jgi:endonuclease YncB( thermonuclease family)
LSPDRDVPGVPDQIASGRTYEAAVAEVTDGDTVDVRFDDGTTEECRLVGLDTPETAENRRFERVEEWPGITDPDVLTDWAARASAFARERLAGETVTLSFDPAEPARDEFGRLLTYVEYRGEGGDPRLFNRDLLAAGLARVYDSGIKKHDEFRAVELASREADAGLWTESDPDATPPVRDDPVSALYVPRPTSVRTADGPLPDDRAPVTAEPSASQSTTAPDAVAYDDTPPLVGVDREARVAVVGGLLVAERYEASEGFAVDTADYGNFPFLTNLFDGLSDRTGDVLVDGGHGQFGVEYALSAEDVAYYRRYLEGQRLALDQRNRLSADYLAGGRALLVTPPVGRFGPGECERVADFRDDGGAVVLLSSAAAPAHARENLDHLAAALGSDLRTNADRVTDPEQNLDGDPALPTTTAFDASDPLFDAYRGEGETKDWRGA